MNNKTLIGIVVAVVIILGAVVLLKGQSNKGSQTTMVPSLKPTSVAPTSGLNGSTSSAMIVKETTVNVTANGFEPQTLTVKIGTKVTWVNKSGGVSNVSSAKHPTHLLYPPLNLGSFDEGKSVSLVFDKVGTYNYHNHLDAGQTGTVVVE